MITPDVTKGRPCIGRADIHDARGRSVGRWASIAACPDVDGGRWGRRRLDYTPAERRRCHEESQDPPERRIFFRSKIEAPFKYTMKTEV